ncbi:MAG: DUF4886 domain-containing protein [Clostridia bacterium]|nr:DUF4886 domain-containing protein [Clostridia bacterium]
MNILAIGNSFSMDATRYLHQIAKADGVEMSVVNLYIGGCPLYRHFKNMHEDAKSYTLQYNGESTGFLVSIKEALLNREWDIVTMQQASRGSVNYETYQPYLDELSAYVKKYAPKAKQLIHQTWAYEEGSDLLCKTMGYSKRIDMYNDIKVAYDKAAEAIGTEIIPSGTLFQNMIEAGIDNIHRDTFHASLGVSRYALALLWYRKFTGNDVTANTFCDFDEAVSEKEIEIVKNCVANINL